MLQLEVPALRLACEELTALSSFCKFESEAEACASSLLMLENPSAPIILVCLSSLCILLIIEFMVLIMLFSVPVI
nr:MAG TPA: hypothetical protein [Caudoviricetes sp.]